MSQSKPLPSSNKEIYSISGKVFVLGEYAVLAGLPALIATVPPRFSLTVQNTVQENSSSRKRFHPQSPISKLLVWAQKMNLPPLAFEFNDPLQGAGGFGASTAQFAMAYLAYAQRNEGMKRRWSQVWSLYRELMNDESGESVPPSGADIVAQWQGGVVFFDPSDSHCMDVWPIFDWSQLLVFSATGQIGRKVPTHEHLASLSKKGLLEKESPLKTALEQSLLQGLSAVRENNGGLLGKTMDEYADILNSSGLETSATSEDRQVLRKLPGVLGVKGAGALQSDAILILMQPGVSDREQVIQAAKSRGLQLVSDGLTCQMGVTCQIES